MKTVIYKVTFDLDWGMRWERRHLHLYFAHEITMDNLIGELEKVRRKSPRARGMLKSAKASTPSDESLTRAFSIEKLDILP
jgi:hypothetical protein